MEPVHVEPTPVPAAMAGSLQAGVVKATSKSPTRIALDRLRRDRVGMVCAGTVAFFVLVAIFAPLLAGIEGQNATDQNFELIDRNGYPTIGFTSDHWFGIEPRLGRDLFARWVYGGRPSLIIAGMATFFTTILGVIIGMAAGYSRGWLDKVLSWIIDFVLSLPFLLFAVALGAVLTAQFAGGTENTTPDQVAKVRFWALIIVLSFFGWATLARLIRGQVLSLREREFIAAAKVLGVPTWRILFRELLPNLVGPIVVAVSLALPAYIITESVLTVLGVGLVEPTPSWGVTIAAAVPYYKNQAPYLWLPVLGITILVLALSLLGDAVRDAFDPKSRR